MVVTGAAGFIGAHLVQALAGGAAEVRATDLKPEPVRAGFGSGSGLDGIRYFRADIRDTAAIETILDGADTVYHLASAHLEVRAGERIYRQVNVDAARALAEACTAAGVRRVVHVSTVGVYGHVTDPPADEDAATRPGNPYERTKLEGELAVRNAAATAGLDVIVLRPAWVYGPGCPRTAKLLGSIQRGRFVYVGRGDNLRHPMYVSDAVEALLLAAGAPPGCSGRVYNVGGPSFVELRELVETCARVLAVAPPRRGIPRGAALALGLAAELAWGAARRDPPFSRRSLAFFENDNAFDIGAAARDLGFVPRVELEEGLRRTVEDLRRAGGLSLA